MKAGPCLCTVAPVNPCELMRLFRIAIDSFIAPDVGVPCGALASSVTCVPLDKSKPRPTRNLECQRPGCAISPPITAASMTRIRMPSVARYRPGRETVTPPPGRAGPPPGARPRESDDELFLGGATYASPSLDGACVRLEVAFLMVVRIRRAAAAGSACAGAIPQVGLGPAIRTRPGVGHAAGRVFGHDLHDGPPQHGHLHARRELDHDIPVVTRDDGAVHPCRRHDALAGHGLVLHGGSTALPVPLVP